MSDEYGCFWGKNLYKYNLRKTPIIEHILYKNDAICISSRPGTGKSLLLKHLMCNLTTATPFLDLYKIPKACNVLYIQTEGDRSETLERLDNMRAGLQLNDKRWVHINLSGIMLNTTFGINSLLKMAKEPKMDYQVIMIDPLYTTVKGNLISSEVATDWIRNVRILKDEWDSTLIIAHHETKDMYHEGRVVNRATDDLFGSAFWSAFFNHNFKLKIYKELHYLEAGKQRSGRIIDKVVMKLIEPRPLMFVSMDEDIDIGLIQVGRTLQEKGRLTAKQIGKHAKVSLSTVYRNLRDLDKNKKVRNVVIEGISYYEWIK